MMFKRFLKIAITLPLAAILIIASSGLTIFMHHCDCEGKTEFSFYKQLGCEMQTEDISSDHSSCDISTPVASDSELEACGCNNEQLSIHLNDVVPVVTVSLNFTKFFIELFEQEIRFEKTDISANSYKFYSESESPPPLLWGKTLLISLSSLKISDTRS